MLILLFVVNHFLCLFFFFFFLPGNVTLWSAYIQRKVLVNMFQLEMIAREAFYEVLLVYI